MSNTTARNLAAAVLALSEDAPMLDRDSLIDQLGHIQKQAEELLKEKATA